MYNVSRLTGRRRYHSCLPMEKKESLKLLKVNFSYQRLGGFFSIYSSCRQAGGGPGGPGGPGASVGER